MELISLFRNERSSFRYARDYQTLLYPLVLKLLPFITLYGNYWLERSPIYALLLQKVDEYWPGDLIIRR